MKIGRNSSCPCASGKKYKKCCLLKEVPPPSEKDIKEVIKIFQKQEVERLALQERGIFINYVRPCTYTNPKTNQKVRAWALGSRLFHTRPENETFHMFIVSHLKEVLGRDWWIEQMRASQKHFIFKCFMKFEEWCKKNAVPQNKSGESGWVAITDGWTKTLLSLAFDVCTLEHTLQLPEYLLKRLRNRGEYQGAHYEIAVAAIFARLGCKIDFLDKNKITTPHCEFIATHNETGVSIAVEAKSRQRPGIKHMEGNIEKEKLLGGDMKRLFDRALKQNPKDKPFIIFIDINAPLTPNISIEQKPWFKDIQKMMGKYPTSTKEKPEKYTGLFFTNFSPHYNAENDSAPNEYLAVIPQYATCSMPNFVFGNMLLKAVQNYGFVPNIKETGVE